MNAEDDLYDAMRTGRDVRSGYHSLSDLNARFARLASIRSQVTRIQNNPDLMRDIRKEQAYGGTSQ